MEKRTIGLTLGQRRLLYPRPFFESQNDNANRHKTGRTIGCLYMFLFTNTEQLFFRPCRLPDTSQLTFKNVSISINNRKETGSHLASDGRLANWSDFGPIVYAIKFK